MFEYFEKLESMFDNWFAKGFLYLGAVVLLLIALYYLMRIFI